MGVVVQEGALRQVVRAALNRSMSVPVAAWSAEFVEEAVLAELTTPTSSSSSSPDTAVNNSSNASTWQASGAEANAVQEHADQVVLAPSALDLVQQYHEATEALHSSSDTARMSAAKPTNSRSSGGNNSKRSKAAARQETTVGSSDTSSDKAPELAGLTQQLQLMLGEVLQDNYQQVEAADVCAFGLKLLHELSQLVEAALAAQQGDEEGLCQLCDREMPLTKHHLIPRDVHKDFKKKGFGFAELQSGLMVCRPCHSAIHRAVPDNKELALHYRTLDTLRQHKDIANFASWARRQRLTSKADVSAVHFRYRR